MQNGTTPWENILEFFNKFKKYWFYNPMIELPASKFFQKNKYL